MGSAEQLTPLGPDSVLWRVAGDVRCLLTFPGNIVLQVLHPAVGAAVGRFSVYRTDPWGRAQRTLDSMLLSVYGGPAAVAEGRRLRVLHRPLHGVDEHGRRFHALAPQAWGWVHNIAYERFVTTEELFGEPLSDSAADQLYAEFLVLGELMGVSPEHLPPDRHAYRRYFDDVVSDRLEPHPTALDVLHRMRQRTDPPAMLPAPVRAAWPLMSGRAGDFGHFLTVGTLPPAVREVLGIVWRPTDERRLRRFAGLVRRATPTLPERLRYLPYAHRARALAREQHRINDRARTSFV